jgi:hypothetical protein
MQYAETLLNNQQAIISTFSEKQSQSEEALNSIHNSLAEKELVIAQFMQVMNFTMENGSKNLTAIFATEI